MQIDILFNNYQRYVSHHLTHRYILILSFLLSRLARRDHKLTVKSVKIL